MCLYYLPWFARYLGGNILSFACTCWNIRHVKLLFIVFSMTLLIFTQYMESLDSSLVFIFILLLWGCSSACSCNSAQKMILLPLMSTLSIITSSSLIVLHGQMFCFTPSLLGWTSPNNVFCIFNSCRCLVSCLLFLHFLYSAWLCLDSQFAMYRSGLGLYNMQIFYSWILSSML